MDYLVLTFLSLLTPFALNLSNVDYTTGLGVKISDNTKFNRFTANSITTGANTDYISKSTEYYGPYGMSYELSAEFKVYPFLDEKFGDKWKRAWIAPRASYDPLRSAVNVNLQSVVSPNPITTPYLFNQHPAFGVAMGYDVIDLGNNNTLSPYFGVNIMRVGYEGYSSFESQEQFDSVLQWFVGVSYQMDDNWSTEFEASTYNVSLLGIEGQKQDIEMRVTKFKLGVTYHINKDMISTQRKHKDVEYINVISSVDNTIYKRIDNAKKQSASTARTAPTPTPIAAPQTKNAEATTPSKKK